MAARQLAKSKVNWVELHSITSKAQVDQYRAFKGKYDTHLTKVNTLPTALPKIDWSFYQKVVPVPGIVDKFKKEYEALKIPEAKDSSNIRGEVDKEEKDYKTYSDKFISIQKEMAKSAEECLGVLKLMPPLDEYNTEIDIVIRAQYGKISPEGKFIKE